LLAYPDLGHLPMEEAPAKTAAEARAFVNGLTAN
jgi:pimeloyl-ACP methyl ester carboxylesterase